MSRIEQCFSFSQSEIMGVVAAWDAASALTPASPLVKVSALE
jgi:hypothetical protein